MPASPYTPERLRAAVESSRTLSEALTRLGVDPKNTSRRKYLRARLGSLGIATRHLEREGTRWSREELEAAVAASTSLYGVLRCLGLDEVGGQHTHIGRRVRALGISTAHFAPPARAEGAQVRKRRGTSADEVLVELEPGRNRRVPGRQLKRALAEIGVHEQCALCGMEPYWQGRPLALEVDHSDGDWRNNRRENLRPLCPNCHATTDTYRRRHR
ncbi:HNH endonuclease signature motif containing protein [Streptomyces sp. NBC_01198]|uniref:HNH endonuclease signature motif containing protein n=1 Tax=Streptomyces sp. NBC_01198 TaxID=2903769 RepID=UPI002E0EC22C|nr:HNH endonuclease [Streptomyces sp. NBC_01198]